MKKAIKFCLIATLSTTIISGCSFEGNNENVKGKEGEKVECTEKCWEIYDAR